MLNPFDPIPSLAAMLHDGACARRHDETVRPADCLSARDAAETMRSALVDAGLAIAPIQAVRWIERTFADLDQEHPVEERASTMSDAEARAREQVWIEVRFHDDREASRLGPYQRAWAELCLADLNFGHDASMAGARIVPEAAWIGTLLADFS